MSEFFAMGGYGAYVWSSYGLGLIVLVLNFSVPFMRERNIIRKLTRKIKFSEEA
jgi:heme exporter protein D